MDLSIVVVSWNTRELLGRCLRSVEATCGDLKYEVLVVDNRSTDGSPEMVREDFPKAILLCNQENLGFAAANNQAIRVSRGRHCLLLNSDAELIGSAALRMVEFLDANPNVGIVGGKLLNSDGSFQSSYNDFPSLRSEIVKMTGLSRWLLPSTFPSYPEELSNECRQVGWVGGALLMARRRAVAVVGSLDESYFMYAEEMDWCYRMAQGGWHVFYLPEACATHWFGASTNRVSERKRAWLCRGTWLFLHRYRSKAVATAYRMLVRGTTCLKLLAWWSSTLSRDSKWRERGWQEIASYRYVLATMDSKG